jgi:SAM-dependent methyltransferase
MARLVADCTGRAARCVHPARRDRRVLYDIDADDPRGTQVSDAELPAEIAAATAYEELFVPALFAEWAPRVLDAARVRLGQRVLDVACGTGILAREAASRVGAGGSVTGLDPGAGLLAVAGRLAPAVEWRQGTAESLPFPDRSFDAVVSQFGLMFFRDRPAALREMLRVLAPGGRLAVAVWDSLDHTPAYASEVALLERIAGRPAADALRAPFVLGDRGELRALFESAGVASVAIATHHGTGRFPSVRTMVEADLRGWLPVMGVVLTEEQIGEMLKEAEHALNPFVTAQGAVEFDSPAHIVTATKP